MSAGAAEKLSVGILGASGYTGAELARLLACHPMAEIKALTSDRSAGQTFASVYPQFAYMQKKPLPDLTRIEEHESNDWAGIDVIFCCLPHATTQEIIAKLPNKLKVVDLSADFRLKDIEMYKTWYGGDHQAPELQKEAVYGLTELKRDEVSKARLIANPGCYPTAAQLPLIPLLQKGVISKDDIIIDAKSGTTGAGRAPKQAFLYCEVTEGLMAYGVASHRHAPEIEQGLTEAAGSNVIVNFTPHLMPMSRGILETIYVKLEADATPADLKKVLQDQYADEQFVTVLPDSSVPHTRHVRGSNHCFINVFPDRVPGRAIIISAIDNLVKGAGGQALQNMNVAFDLPEAMGLEQSPLFP
eukprot:CAMPEP_0113936860 /NCGR_PEP_ID=MMETSP1339-20121228/3628_1 /TAXON_ID=94617 /ORGANISM="Fibrocapsa japonica" /LENGTH=357 /DNA_ID=CAMNT_0000939429 /DNA_START=191 /DNA_END=1264 /DNA_ORIENTATION=+ /assembly_acc=CAM_ASM_000762